jgi:hypothetical protein
MVDLDLEAGTVAMVCKGESEKANSTPMGGESDHRRDRPAATDHRLELAVERAFVGERDEDPAGAAGPPIRR